MAKVTTLVVVYDNEKILLGLKKRGFGAGRWNGFGGKVDVGESIEQAAHRELQEEIGIAANQLELRGQIIFTFEDGHEPVEVNIFTTESFSGEPAESEEMKPQWYLHSEIPYDEMWPDDLFWLPLVLAGKNVSGSVHFDSPGSQVILQNSIQEDVQKNV